MVLPQKIYDGMYKFTRHQSDFSLIFEKQIRRKNNFAQSRAKIKVPIHFSQSMENVLKESPIDLL